MKNINIELSDFLKNIDGLRNLVRYQSAPRVSEETVAEHSFFVTAYVLKLHDYYKFDILKALKIAILHDYAESFISDVPHPIKKKFPLIGEQLQKAEYDVNATDISEQFANELNEMNDLSTPEGCIVALADILSVITYAKYETELGNSHYMNAVKDNAIERVKELVIKCQKYLNIDISNNVLTEVTKFIDNI